MEDITRSAEKKVNEGADKIQQGIDKARRQGVDLVEKSFPVADEAIEKAQAKGEALWNKAKTKGHDLLEEVESSSQQVWNGIKSYVRNKPAQALGYALLVGVILGFSISPKKRG